MMRDRWRSQKWPVRWRSHEAHEVFGMVWMGEVFVGCAGVR